MKMSLELVLANVAIAVEAQVENSCKLLDKTKKMLYNNIDKESWWQDLGNVLYAMAL